MLHYLIAFNPVTLTCFDHYLNSFKRNKIPNLTANRRIKIHLWRSFITDVTNILDQPQEDFYDCRNQAAILDFHHTQQSVGVPWF